MAYDSHLKKVGKTERSNNTQQHAIGCESLHIDTEGRQQTISYTAALHRELRGQFIAARNGKPPWSTKGIIRTVRQFEHHDFVSCAIFVYKCRNKGPREWTKEALKTPKEATASYMVEVIAKASF
jgi:hypothetical protein